MTNYDDFSDDQRKCIELLIKLFRGEHRLPSKVKRYGQGISINTPLAMATYDNNVLTTLVLLAHEMCIRAEIEACNFKNIRIVLHKRKGREGRLYERHPDAMDALKQFNEVYVK